MTCPVCNDEGTVRVRAYTGGVEVDSMVRPCSAPSCIVAGVNRLYREMDSGSLSQ